jgi:thioredoxin 1
MSQGCWVRRGVGMIRSRSIERFFTAGKIARPWYFFFILLSCVFFGSQIGPASAAGFDDVPVKGMVTMIDLGATSCIPCKMMAPIMEKLEKEYRGKAAIVFIDVWKHKEQANRFGIRAIPTQVFYDEGRKEVYRHVGFMAEKDIVAQLKKMGIE